MFPRDPSRVALGIYDALNHRDLDRAVAGVSEGLIWFDTPAMAMIYGQDGLRGYFRRWLGAFPDFTVDVGNVVRADAWVVVEYVGRGTQEGTLPWPPGLIAATGQKASIHFCDVLEMQHGIVMTGRTYYDVRGVLSQVGLLPARLLLAA